MSDVSSFIEPIKNKYLQSFGSVEFVCQGPNRSDKSVMVAQGEMEFPGIYLPVFVEFGLFFKDQFLRPNFNQERASSRDYPRKGVTSKYRVYLRYLLCLFS